MNSIFAANFPGVISAFNNLQLNARDFFDVLIFAFLIYAAIRFLQETHSAPLLVGLLTIAAIYVAALFFDLPLTLLALRPFFGIALIILAIIFQKELRRFFSYVGFFGIGKRLHPLQEELCEIISHAVFRLKDKKMGAILVFTGREPLDRHLEGGYRLNGEISAPLLLSIFDPSSPGHDGAVIIENNRIKRFATHLPLADNMELVKNFGLRHRAAMGLSERADALTIVISEERSTIGIAEHARLDYVWNEKELQEKISGFYENRFPKMKLVLFSKWFLRNMPFILFSFAAAFSIWLMVSSRFAMVQKTIAGIPEFRNLPPEYILEDFSPDEISITLRGRSADFDALGGVIKVPFSLNKTSAIGWQRLEIASSGIKLPLNFILLKTDPKVIKIKIQKTENESPPSSR